MPGPQRAARLPLVAALSVVLLLLSVLPAAASGLGPSTAQIRKGTVSTAGLKASVEVTFTRGDDLDLNRAVRAFGDAERARLVDLAKPSRHYALTKRFFDGNDTIDHLVPVFSGDPARDYAAARKAHRSLRGVQKIFNVSNGFQEGEPGIGLLESFITCVDNRHLVAYDTRTGKTIKAYGAKAWLITMRQDPETSGWHLFATVPVPPDGSAECTPRS